MAHSSHSERSIHEMLKDTPPMNESSSSIHSGTEGRIKPPNSLPFRNSGEWAMKGDERSEGGPLIDRNKHMHSIYSLWYFAAPTTPITSPFNGDSTFLKSGASKIDTIKNWSISTYKCTRQLMLEKLGRRACGGSGNTADRPMCFISV